jgi:hypothetical protein
MRSRFSLLVALLATVQLVALPGIGITQVPRLWLNETTLPSWNSPGAPIPVAPCMEIDPRCRELARPAELDEDKLVQEQGWRLEGPYQGGWGIVVVLGAAGYDGMCRPVQFQAFVFVDGVFAGTLAPEPMNSRTAGPTARSLSCSFSE